MRLRQLIDSLEQDLSQILVTENDAKDRARQATKERHQKHQRAGAIRQKLDARFHDDVRRATTAPSTHKESPGAKPADAVKAKKPTYF